MLVNCFAFRVAIVLFREIVNIVFFLLMPKMLLATRQQQTQNNQEKLKVLKTCAIIQVLLRYISNADSNKSKRISYVFCLYFEALLAKL